MVYRQMGLKGLQSIQGVGSSIGKQIELFISSQVHLIPLF